MFLGIKDSTAIAEKLNNKLYSALIKDFFYDISEAIIMFNGEIYQYAGDEIIVTWPLKGDNLNCIRTFFKMKEIITNPEIFHSNCKSNTKYKVCAEQVYHYFVKTGGGLWIDKRDCKEVN